MKKNRTVMVSEYKRDTDKNCNLEEKRVAMLEDATFARVAILKMDADIHSFTETLLNDEPAIDGQYIHTITCNAGRNKPVGNDMCSCGIGRRIRGYIHKIAELEAQVEKMKCCGNCKYDAMDDVPICMSSSICHDFDKWEARHD